MITHLTQKQPALKGEAAFRTESMNKRKWPVPDALPLAQYYITTVSQEITSSSPDGQVHQKGEAEGVAEEAKV
jgi:hypothetical protein